MGVMGTALLCAQDVERGTAKYLALAPLPAAALVAGRILGGLLAAILVTAPIIALRCASPIARGTVAATTAAVARAVCVRPARCATAAVSACV